MSDSIYLLDFRRGTVEEVDNSLPPRGLRGPADERADDRPGVAYSFAALGSPPQRPSE